MTCKFAVLCHNGPHGAECHHCHPINSIVTKASKIPCRKVALRLTLELLQALKPLMNSSRLEMAVILLL